jgi:hypothetical protein
LQCVHCCADPTPRSAQCLALRDRYPMPEKARNLTIAA